MDAQEFFAQLPRGKEDKPLLFGFGPLEYNKDDIDGLYYMLDRDFSGCLLLNFAKPHESGNSGKGLAERGNAAALCAEIYADYGKPLGARHSDARVRK